MESFGRRKTTVGRSVGLFAAPAAVNAQNLVQKNHFPFFTAPLSFPKCPDNSAKTAAAPSSAVGKRGRPSGGEGRYFTWSVHLFSPIAGWVGIGWSVDGRSFGRAVSQFFLSKQPSALQQQQLPPLCLQFMRWNKIGKCVGEKERARWDKNRNSRRWKTIIRTSKRPKPFHQKCVVQ